MRDREGERMSNEREGEREKEIDNER